MTSLFPVDDVDRAERASASREDARESDAAEAWLRARSFPGVSDEREKRRRSASASSSDSSMDSRDRERRRRRERKRERKREDGERKRGRRAAVRRDAEEVTAIEERLIRYGREHKDSRRGDDRMWATKERSLDSRSAYEDARRDAENLAYGAPPKADGVRFKRAMDRARAWYELAAKMKKSEYYGLKIVSRDEDKGEVKERYFTRSAQMRTRDRNAPKFRKPALPNQSRREVEAEYVQLRVSSNAEDGRIEEDGMESVNAYLMRQTKLFNEKTRQTPEDVNVWIDFAKFQDQFMALTRKRSEITQLVEKKIAILEQALRHHPHNATLIVALLTEREKVEESAVIKSRWLYACEQNSHNADIWRAFIRYRMRDFGDFSANGVRADYNTALRSLAMARNKLRLTKDSASNDVIRLERAIVDLIIDACRFDIQSGATERAVARMQAAIEFGCLSPENGHSDEELLDLFESFWECGEPRIGEPNAVGWFDWVMLHDRLRLSTCDVNSDIRKAEHAAQAPRDVPPPPPPPAALPLAPGAFLGGGWAHFEEPTGDDVEDNDEEKPSAIDMLKLEEKLEAAADVEIDDEILRRWVEKEWVRSRDIWKPARLMDVDQDDEDTSLPKAIWFDEIKDGLIRLREKSVKERLWLQSLRLVGALESLPSDFEYDSRLDSSESASGPFMEALRVFKTVEGDMHENTWFHQCLGLEHSWVVGEAGRSALAANMFRVYTRADPTLFSCRVVKTKDDAKLLLSGDHENSLKLWSHLAELEWRSGRKASARKIYTKIFPTAVSARVQDIAHLTLSWVECEMSSGDAEGVKNALKILIALASIGSKEEFSPESARDDESMSILRAKKLFNEKMIHALAGGGVWADNSSAGLQSHGVALIRCFAWFLFLLKDSCDDIQRVLRDTPASVQRDGENAANWHTLHIKLLLMRPITSRRQSLECALHVFPTSLTLLLKLSELELLVQGRQRMRRYLDLEFERQPSVMTVFLALGLELGKPFSSNPRAISVLERALDPTATTAQSPLVWLAYLRAYLACGQTSSAKTIFLRAINAVPWNKTIWLYGIENLKDAFSAKERAALLDVMREKDILVRTDVFEVQMEVAVEN